MADSKEFTGGVGSKLFLGKGLHASEGLTASIMNVNE